MIPRRAALWSLLDQALLSGCHFALGVAVLRTSSKEGYGAYVLSWAVLMLLSGLQNALISSQLTVRAAGLPVDEQLRLSGAYLRVQNICIGGLSLMAVMAALSAWLIADTYASAAILAVGVAFAGTSLRELARSILLLRTDARSMFTIDLAYVVVLAVLTCGQILLSPADWLPTLVVAALGIGSAVAALPFLRSLSAHRPDTHAAWDVVRSSLANGTWASFGVIVTHIQSQSYVYLLGALAGLAVTAEASAARLLLMPLSLAFTSIQRVVYPQWVALARDRNSEMLGTAARNFWLATTALVVIYGAAMVWAAQHLIGWAMGAAYEASAAYVVMFAGMVWAEATRSIVSLRLQAVGRFRVIALCNAFTAAIVIGAAAFAIGALGASAAIAIQAAGDVLLAALLLTAIHARRSERAAASPATVR